MTKILHFEPTSRCNAACPMCARNVNGDGCIVSLSDLSFDKFQAHVTSRLVSLDKVFFCGSLGDPCADKDLLKKILSELLKQIEKPLIHIKTTPFVILVVGVNGAGKTTTIGKLTKLLLDEGKSVLIAAGDTFRAAAKEQLQVWGDRNNVTVISQNTGDPSAVIFDAMQSAKAKGIDIVIADTAGRLPTQKHLIDELAKIKKVIQKFDETAPHETILVLDANTGQNAINQIKVFNEAVSLTGLIMTKLDGTAKGGIVAAIAKEQPIPLRFIGVGEKIDDLKIFSAEDYVEGMLE